MLSESRCTVHSNDERNLSNSVLDEEDIKLYTMTLFESGFRWVHSPSLLAPFDRTPAVPEQSRIDSSGSNGQQTKHEAVGGAERRAWTRRGILTAR